MTAWRAVVGILALIAIGCDEEPAVIPAAPTSAVTCLGVPAAKCDQLVQQAVEELRVPGFRSIQVTCTKVPCTDLRGEVTIDIVDAGGRRTGMGTGWETLGPIGNPAPEPSA